MATQEITEKKTQPLQLHEQERLRLDDAGVVAKQLLALKNSRMNELLGVNCLDFEFERRFVTVTNHTESSGVIPLDKITGSKAKVRVEVNRTDMNILNPDGELDGRGIKFITGGGIRAKYVVAAVDPETNTHTLENENVLEIVRSARSETEALAGSMAVKAMTVDSHFFIEAVLSKNGRDDLISEFKKEVPGGGGKGEDTLFVPETLRSRNLTAKEQVEAGKKLNLLTFASLKVWARELTVKGALLTSITRAAGDQNTTFTVEIDGTLYSGMDAVVMGHREGLNELGIEEKCPQAIASGKFNEGHLPFRDISTGVSGVYAVEATAERFGVDLKDKEAMIRGCGSAAQGMSEEFRRLGVKITAIAAESGIITKADGFTEEDQKSLFDFVVGEKMGTAQQWANLHQGDGVKVYFETNADKWPDQLRQAVLKYWDEKQPAIIVEAATQETIDLEAVDHLPKECILLETANLVTCPEAAEKMRGTNIHRITAPLANRGGYFISEFERARDVLEYDFSEDDMRSALKAVQIRDVNRMYDIIKLAEENKIYLTPEQAFYSFAITNAQRLYNHYKSLPLVT